MNGNKFLQTSQPPEFQHRLLPSSEWEMGVFTAIVLPPANLLNLSISDGLHGGAI